MIKACHYTVLWRMLYLPVDKIPDIHYNKISYNSRACLKIHSRHLHAPLCMIFAPDSGYIARNFVPFGYAPFIWHKSSISCPSGYIMPSRVHLSESNFQTRSGLYAYNAMCYGEHPAVRYVPFRALFHTSCGITLPADKWRFG